MIRCDVCGREIGHDPRCPKHVPETAIHYCPICGEGILVGEEYVENEKGEYFHWDCFSGTLELLHCLGYGIKVMEESYEEEY